MFKKKKEMHRSSYTSNMCLGLKQILCLLEVNTRVKPLLTKYMNRMENNLKKKKKYIYIYIYIYI